MKGLMWYGGENIKYEDIDVPEPGDDEVLMKIAYSGICGSEMHILSGVIKLDDLQYPAILGHEFSGTVAQLGKNVTGYTIGQKVTAHPFTGCGACYWCQTARENFCTNPFNVITNPRAGGFAEYTIVKAKQVYPLPDTMSLKQGAIVEPVSIAVHAMRHSNIKPGSTVAILGGGMIGLQCLQLALHTGAGLTILSDIVDKKLELAKKLGADVTIHPGKENLTKKIMDLTDNYGVDVVIEAAGTKATHEVVGSLLKKTGTLLIVGVAPKELPLGLTAQDIMMRELKIHGSFWSPYSFREAMGIMPKLEIDSLISHVFPFSEFEQAFAVQKSGMATKVLFEA